MINKKEKSKISLFFTSIFILFLRYFPRLLTKLANKIRGENGRKKLKENLDNLERKMLEGINYTEHYVEIKNKQGHSRYIRTISMNTSETTKTPVVLVHGFMTGIPDWRHNIVNIYDKRATYAFDLLGFGKSSREEFSLNFDQVEEEYINSIEEWRREMKLNKMILISHSFGSYLSAIYAFKYPDRVAGLIFEDPWGFGGVSFEKLFKLFY